MTTEATATEAMTGKTALAQLGETAERFQGAVRDGSVCAPRMGGAEGDPMTEEELAGIEARLCDTNMAVARHARTDVPRLLSEVRRLQGENAELSSRKAMMEEGLTGLHNSYNEIIDGDRAKIAALEAEVERLTHQLCQATEPGYPHETVVFTSPSAPVAEAQRVKMNYAFPMGNSDQWREAVEQGQ